MIPDLLLLTGLALIVAAGFLLSVILGIALAGVMLVLVSLALADGRGVGWRS